MLRASDKRSLGVETLASTSANVQELVAVLVALVVLPVVLAVQVVPIMLSTKY